MWILKVDIENFQKHSKFVAEFTPHVNCIIGETDKGKSCLVRAIKWVLFNEPKGDIVRKSGTRETRVTLVLDNGYTVTRIKSSKENAYIINETRYDSFGKDIPEEVTRVLSAIPMVVEKDGIILNISDQLAPPFLLSESGGLRMKVLNKLIGSDILDFVAVDLNKDILRIGREEKVVAETLAKNRVELSGTEADLYAKSKVLRDVQALYEKLSQKVKVYEQVQGLYVGAKAKSEEIGRADSELKTIALPVGIEELSTIAVRFTKVLEVFTRVVDTKKEIEATAMRAESMVIPEDLEIYISLATAFQSAKILHQKASAGRTEIRATIETLGVLGTGIGQLKGRYSEILKQYGKCPVCHTEVTQEVLDRIEL
jgi:exonuclease SbcC